MYGVYCMYILCVSYTFYILLYISIFQYRIYYIAETIYICNIKKEKKMSINDIIRNVKKRTKSHTSMYRRKIFFLRLICLRLNGRTCKGILCLLSRAFKSVCSSVLVVLSNGFSESSSLFPIFLNENKGFDNIHSNVWKSKSKQKTCLCLN